MKPTKSYTVKSTNPKMSSGAVERLPKYEKGGLVMGGGGSGKKGMAGGGAVRVPLSESASAVISGGMYNVKEGGKRYKGVEKGTLGMRFNRGNTTVEVSKNYAPQALPAGPGMEPVMVEERMTSRKPVTSISITKRV